MCVLEAGGLGGGGPSADPGNARPRPGNSASSPRGGPRRESHSVRGSVPRLPECAGRGRDRRGAGSHRALPPPSRGSRASPGRGFRVGWGPRGSASASTRQGAAALRSVSGGARRGPPAPAYAPPPLQSHPLSSAPSRPGTAPALTLCRRVRQQRAPNRELRGRGGPWKASGGEPGQEEERRDGRGKRLERRSARSTDGGWVPGEEGAAPGRKRGGRLPRPSSGSQPPPCFGQSPAPLCQGEGGGGREEGDGPTVLPQHTPPPSPGLICLMQCG